MHILPFALGSGCVSETANHGQKGPFSPEANPYPRDFCISMHAHVQKQSYKRKALNVTAQEPSGALGVQAFVSISDFGRCDVPPVLGGGLGFDFSPVKTERASGFLR